MGKTGAQLQILQTVMYTEYESPHKKRKKNDYKYMLISPKTGDFRVATTLCFTDECEN